MPNYDPLPDTIAERCLEIQAGWDEETRESRRVSMPKKDRTPYWTPPTINITEMNEIISENKSLGG